MVSSYNFLTQTVDQRKIPLKKEYLLPSLEKVSSVFFKFNFKKAKSDLKKLKQIYCVKTEFIQKSTLNGL